MKSWNELTRTQKILLGLLVTVIVMLVPESSFLIDVGGVDLILFFLMMYSQNIKTWFEMHLGVVTYPRIETRTYIKSMSLTSMFFWITSSFVFSSGLFLVLMFMRKG